MDNLKALRILHSSQVYLPSVVPGLGGGGYYIFSSMRVLAHASTIEEAMVKGGFLPPKFPVAPAFVAHDLDVVRAGAGLATAEFKTVARRIANALNAYAPNENRV